VLTVTGPARERPALDGTLAGFAVRAALDAEMNKRTLLKFLGALALVGLAATLFLRYAVPPPAPQTLLRPDDMKLLVVGERIYRARCAACHGANLEGQANWRERGADGLLPAPPHDESGHTWHHPDEQLFRLTKFGVARVANMPDYESAMPAFEGTLSDEDIVAVLSWIKSKWPPAVRAKHDRINAQYEASRQH
jgi:mono/diheme cytochrome c family protein